MQPFSVLGKDPTGSDLFEHQEYGYIRSFERCMHEACYGVIISSMPRSSLSSSQ